MNNIVNKWNYRIIEYEYDNFPSKYILETDQGSEGRNWVFVYCSIDLNKVREVRKERKEFQTRKPPKVIK